MKPHGKREEAFFLVEAAASLLIITILGIALHRILHLKRRALSEQNKSRIKDEGGYTLVTVLLLFLVISVVTMSLLELTVISHSGVAVQENILRARQNAENGAIEGMAKLENKITELNGQLRNIGVDVHAIKSKLNDIYRNHIASETPEYKVFIDENTREVLADDPSGGLYSEKVDLIAEGRSGQFTQTYRKTVVLSTIPDLFKYALLSRGDVRLNGAPYIEGDLYAEGNVYTGNQSKVDRAYDLLSIPLIESSKQVTTSLPAMMGNLSAEGAVNGISYHNLTENHMKSSFSVSPSLIMDRPTVVNIPVKEKVAQIKSIYDFYKGQIDNREGLIRIQIKLLSNDHIIKDYPQPGDMFFEGDLDLNENETFSPSGNVYVSGFASLNGDVRLSPGHYIYVNGDHTIKSINLFSNLQELLSIANVQLDLLFIHISLDDIVEALTTILNDLLGEKKYAAEFYNLSISGAENGSTAGAIYINKNAVIHHSIDANTSIYVNGDTDISELSTGTGGAGENKNTLLLMSEGKIRLANEKVYENEPVMIDTFLYSNDSIQIDGNLSNLLIHGGVFGKEITLNALKGRVQLTPFHSSKVEEFTGHLVLLNELKNKIPILGGILDLLNGLINIPMKPLYIDDQSSLDYTESRLTIRYKKEMILNPPGGIPTLNQVTLSEIDSGFK